MIVRRVGRGSELVYMSSAHRSCIGMDRCVVPADQDQAYAGVRYPQNRT